MVWPGDELFPSSFGGFASHSLHIIWITNEYNIRPKRTPGPRTYALSHILIYVHHEQGKFLPAGLILSICTVVIRTVLDLQEI